MTFKAKYLLTLLASATAIAALSILANPREAGWISLGQIVSDTAKIFLWPLFISALVILAVSVVELRLRKWQKLDLVNALLSLPMIVIGLFHLW